ncbi:MAG: HAMP domain-containing sensor histidine kinase [Thermodesulfobacteriota bacterium]|nr:HAMP domain-containing sensor histidine kinase [Thermodesulfobacteriota bacterium]
MDTHFATPQRTSRTELTAKIDFVSSNPVMSGLLFAISGLLAVLDENRQIVAINDSFLKMLGINDSSQALGLRPGEALQCVHAEDMPAGCGTSEFCASCGAAIAIVASQEHNRSEERTCALTVNRGAGQVDMAMLVRSQPLSIEEQWYYLVFLRDITKQQQRASLERMFFHDINNTLGMLMGNTQLLLEESSSEYARYIHQASLRLYKEVSIQRALSREGNFHYQAFWQDTTADRILEELASFFVNHRAARGRELDVSRADGAVVLTTDVSLLLRVLGNMVINALEATGSGETVRVWTQPQAGAVCFCVWNREAIPPAVTKRIFQRHYSTKQEEGRGLGTFSMKLFGEKILGGRVSFTTSEQGGTVFRLCHPAHVM